MKFSELLTQGIEEDIQKDGYTRYMIRYFDKFKIRFLSLFSSGNFAQNKFNLYLKT